MDGIELAESYQYRKGDSMNPITTFIKRYPQATF